MDDNPVGLEIDPSLAIPGGVAVARLRLENLSDGSLPKGSKSRPWRIQSGQTRLGASPRLEIPIQFPVADQLGDLLIEAYLSAAFGIHRVIARGRLLVLESPAEMLRMAIEAPNSGYAAVVFDKVSNHWGDERIRREKLSEMLVPYFRDACTVDRAIEFSLRLNQRIFERIAYACVGQESFDLTQQFYATVWRARRDFNPDRGPFEVWAHHKLRGCRSDYLRQKGRRLDRSAVEFDERRDAPILNDGSTRRLEDIEYLEKTIAQLETRFSRQKVEMFLRRSTESPRPTYFEIAVRSGFRPEANPDARALAAKRVIDQIADYVNCYLKVSE